MFVTSLESSACSPPFSWGCFSSNERYRPSLSPPAVSHKFTPLRCAWKIQAVAHSGINLSLTDTGAFWLSTSCHFRWLSRHLRVCVCVPNISPRGLRSLHAHLIDTGIDSSLGIPRQTVNRKRLENAKAGSRSWWTSFGEWGKKKWWRSHLRAADPSTFPIKK